MTGDMEGERINQSVVQHLKSKLHEERNRNAIMYLDLRMAQEKADLYEGLWNKLSAEVCNTFATHPLNPQLLYSYMVNLKMLAEIEQER